MCTPLLIWLLINILPCNLSQRSSLFYPPFLLCIVLLLVAFKTREDKPYPTLGIGYPSCSTIQSINSNLSCWLGFKDYCNQHRFYSLTFWIVAIFFEWLYLQKTLSSKLYFPSSCLFWTRTSYQRFQ